MSRAYVLTTADADAWQATLPATTNVLGSLEFARLQERYRGEAGRLFVFEAEGGKVVYPFFLRPIEDGGAGPGAGRRWDAVTPEYTGPLCQRRCGARTVPCPCRNFSGAFDDFARQQRIVSEFAHLNPWSAAVELLEPHAVEVNRELIYLDLTWGEEGIWKRSFSSEARNNVRRASAAGVRARPAQSVSEVLEFHRLHKMTMERRAALERYFLPPEYFVAVYQEMPANALFMLSEYRGRIVAGGLYFSDASDVYWHLSAVDLEFSAVRPVNASHHEAVRRFIAAGKRRLLCGGAYQPGDGVFRFKAGFSPLRIPFKVYKRIHDPDSYAAFTSAWRARHPRQPLDAEFFPAYRAPPEAGGGSGGRELAGVGAGGQGLATSPRSALQKSGPAAGGR